MTEQTRNNKAWLERLEHGQEELVYSLIGQAVRAAKAAGVHAIVWVDEGGLTFNITGKGYLHFNGETQDIAELIDIVEWLLNGAPKEDEPEKDDGEEDDDCYDYNN